MQCGDLRMDLKIKPKLFALLGAIAVVAQPVQLLGANGEENIVQVPLGGAQEVDAHGICRKILNEGTNTILVPVRSAEEWSSGENAFLNNIAGMSGVSIESCGPAFEWLHVSATCYYPPMPNGPNMGCLNYALPKWKDRVVAAGYAVTEIGMPDTSGYTLPAGMEIQQDFASLSDGSPSGTPLTYDHEHAFTKRQFKACEENPSGSFYYYRDYGQGNPTFYGFHCP